MSQQATKHVGEHTPMEDAFNFSFLDADEKARYDAILPPPSNHCFGCIVKRLATVLEEDSPKWDFVYYQDPGAPSSVSIMSLTVAPIYVRDGISMAGARLLIEMARRGGKGFFNCGAQFDGPYNLRARDVNTVNELSRLGLIESHREESGLIFEIVEG